MPFGLFAQKIAKLLGHIPAEPIEPEVNEFSLKDGQLKIALGGKGVQEFALRTSAWLLDNKVIHYVEIKIDATGDPAQSFVFTTRRLEGKTPHTLRREAEEALHNSEEWIKVATKLLYHLGNDHRKLPPSHLLEIKELLVWSEQLKKDEDGKQGT